MQSNEAKKLTHTPASGGVRANREGALDDLPAGTELMRGQYTIESYLNSGGFGITYCASDSLGRTVVIKECFPTIMCKREGTKIAPRKIEYAVELSKLIEQFVSEAHALAALKHKNILHVHQVFEENDTAYMAIDFIDGPDLMDVIQTEPDRLTPEEILRLTRRSLGAIKYIHDKGMLHRDISPDNILIDEQGEPVLIDFGAALRSNAVPNRVFSKVKFVKDGYSPQEFYIEGSDQGTYSDIYGFAATIYHAINGAPPIDGQQRLSARAQGQDDPYVPLAGTTDEYPDGFLEAIDTALSIMPADRLQTADEWLDLIPARPTRIVSKRAPAPKRRTRPTVEANQAKTRLLADSLAPLDIVEDAGSTDTPSDVAPKADAPQALPDDEDAAPLALSLDNDEIGDADLEEDLYLNEEDDTPVDLRALMPVSTLASTKPKQPEVEDQLEPEDTGPVNEVSPRTGVDALPEDDDTVDEVALDLEPEVLEGDQANDGFAAETGTAEDGHEDPAAPQDEFGAADAETLDPLEAAIAETTEGTDASLEKRISRIVTQAIEQEPQPEELEIAPAPEQTDDAKFIKLNAEDVVEDDDQDGIVAGLRPTPRANQGKFVIGGAAAALVLVAGVGVAMFFRGPEDTTTAEAQRAAAPTQNAGTGTTSPALAAAPAPDQNPSPPEVAPSLAADASASTPAPVSTDTPPLAFSIADVPAELQANRQATSPGTLPNIVTQPPVSGSSSLPATPTGELAFAPVLTAEPPATFAIAPTEVTALDLGTLAAAPVLATAGTDADLETVATSQLAPVQTDAEPVAVAALTRPQTQTDGIASEDFDFEVQIAAAELPVVAEASEVPRPAALDTLENQTATAGTRPNVDATPPAPLPRTPVAAVQVLGAHWDVVMPFASEVEQVRNANTARITEVTNPVTAQKSGPWVADGTVIFSLNGENLRPGVPVSTHLLDNLVIDPDGFTRASVRYRDVATGRLDLGLLTIPVVRDISLADQTRLSYLTLDGSWVVQVASVGSPSETGLQVGDILLSEETTGIGIANEDALRAVYDRLVEAEIGTARFRITRSGATQTVRVPLVREDRP